MEKAGKAYIFVGLVIGVVVVAIGHLLAFHTRQKDLVGLITKCETEATAIAASSDSHWREFTFVCDIERLGPTAIAPGVQGEIVLANSHIYSPSVGSIILGILITLLFSLPYLWYFVLRRLRELRDVIAGK